MNLDLSNVEHLVGRMSTPSLTAIEAANATLCKRIMLTGYWPPTNEMIRQFTPNPDQNPAGWQGANWEGRGYDIYAFFPEFENFPDDPKGTGDFEVDYQDTSTDWWEITEAIRPLAIITFSQKSGHDPPHWEVNSGYPNYSSWRDDYLLPFQPTPSPPDDSLPPGAFRYSSLPMEEIVDALDAAGLGINPFISGGAGRFLSGFIAYHGAWYHDLHADPGEPFRNVAAGHIHVDGWMPLDTAIEAVDVTLRVLIEYLDSSGEVGSCDDRNICTYDQCINGLCEYEANMYADVDHDSDVDLFDLFCILNGLSGDFSVCSFEDDDLEPCAGDGDIDLFDLFAVLNAFSGIDPCCGGLP